MCRNVSDDGDMFKETKLLMYCIRGYHGYVTKTDISYAKQIILPEISQNILLFNFVNISKPKKLFAKPNSFCELGSQFPPLFAALSYPIPISLVLVQWQALQNGRAGVNILCKL